MTIRNNPAYVRRNDRCPCGSGRKFKVCCSQDSPRAVNGPHSTRTIGYIDSGEAPVRYVITDSLGTSFFCDKDNKILVFKDRAEAFAVANLDEFSSQQPGEINVAGVGAEKFTHLCETLPYLEVAADEAIALVRERLAVRKQQIQEGENDGNQDQEAGAQSQEIGNAGQEEANQGAEASAGDRAPEQAL